MLLRVTDGRVRVGDRIRFASELEDSLQGGGGLVTIWGLVSYGCKLDLVTVQRTLTGKKHRTDIFNPAFRQPFPKKSTRVYE